MMIKSILLAASLFATAAFAQVVSIGSPSPNAVIAAGQPLTVEVFKPNAQSPSTDVALIIAIAPCSNNHCPDPSQQLGSILYTGPFNPIAHPQDASGWKPPYQNFTVTVPEGLQGGEQVVLSVTHFALIGAGPSPFLEQKTVDLTVIGAGHKRAIGGRVMV